MEAPALVAGVIHTLYELPPHKRNITIRELVYSDSRYESDWDINSENTYFLQLPYVFLLFGNVDTFMSFGKEPFGPYTDLWFPSLPNVFDSPSCQVCTPSYKTHKDRLEQFWHTAFYDFSNRKARFSGTGVVSSWLGGYRGWANLDLNGLYRKMTWGTVNQVHGAFRDFQLSMEG